MAPVIRCYDQFTPSGWLGWKADRVETVEGRECRVHNVDGLSFITITRREHLSPEDIKFNKDFTQAMVRVHALPFDEG